MFSGFSRYKVKPAKFDHGKINKEIFRILTDFQGIKGIAILDVFLQGQLVQRFQLVAGERNLRGKDY